MKQRARSRVDPVLKGIAYLFFLLAVVTTFKSVEEWHEARRLSSAGLKTIAQVEHVVPCGPTGPTRSGQIRHSLCGQIVFRAQDGSITESAYVFTNPSDDPSSIPILYDASKPKNFVLASEARTANTDLTIRLSIALLFMAAAGLVLLVSK